MKYYSKLNIYKASNVTFNPSTLDAFSYSWWKFSTSYKGNVIFNNARYSNTTCRHQSKVSRVMRDLGVVPDFILRFTLKSLDNTEEALRDEISLIQREISKLNDLINKKGTRLSKNNERKILIYNYMNDILDLESLLNQ